MDGTTCQTPVSICCQSSSRTILVTNGSTVDCHGWIGFFPAHLFTRKWSGLRCFTCIPAAPDAPPTLTVCPFANVDVHLSNRIKHGQTLRNIISHCIMDGLRRLNCHHRKFHGSFFFSHFVALEAPIFSMPLWDRNRGVLIRCGRVQCQAKL